MRHKEKQKRQSGHARQSLCMHSKHASTDNHLTTVYVVYLAVTLIWRFGKFLLIRQI